MGGSSGGAGFSLVIVGFLLVAGLLLLVVWFVNKARIKPKSTSDDHEESSRRPAKSIFCVNCGAPNLADSQFCTKCGTAIVVPQRGK